MGTTQRHYSSGNDQYYAWYEQLDYNSPNPEIQLSLAVHPGDEMFAYLNYNSGTGQAEYILQNITTGFSTSFFVSASSYYNGTQKNGLWRDHQ